MKTGQIISKEELIKEGWAYRQEEKGFEVWAKGDQRILYNPWKEYICMVYKSPF